MNTNGDLNNLLPFNPVRKVAQDDRALIGVKRVNAKQNESVRPFLSDEHSRLAAKKSFGRTVETVSKKAALLQDRGRRAAICREAFSSMDESGQVTTRQESVRMTAAENKIASDSAEYKIAHGSTEDKNNAGTMIRAALHEVAGALGLDAVSMDKLNNIQFEQLSQNDLDQFSEILFVLKSIAELLQQSVKGNIPIEINGMSLKPEQAALLEQNLRMQMFRMNIAFEWLGYAEDIAKNIAGKTGAPLLDGGIPQASNPATVTMPDNSMNPVAGNLMDTISNNLLKVNEENIAVVVSRIALLVNTQGMEKQNALMSNESLTGSNAIDKDAESGIVSMEYSKTGAVNGDPRLAGKEISLLDAQVLRRLLNIDAQSNPSDGSAVTKEGKPSGKDVLSGNTISVTPQPVSLNPLQVKTQADTLQKQLDQVSGVLTTLKQDHLRNEAPVKLSFTTMKNIEESVLLQIQKRFSDAVRSGVHEVRMVLKPESLGDVRMTIQMNGDVIMARISVENQHVKQIIESNLQALKNALEEQNLHTGSFDVNVQQEREDTGREFFTGNGGIATENDSMPAVEELNNGQTDTGRETGRRFGTNTIEYFA